MKGKIMKRPILCAAMAAAAAAATPALAQDEPPPATGPPAGAPFGGFRVEALAGYDEGFVYGVGAGYDLRTGGAVLGVEAEATDSTDKACFNGLIVAGDRFCSRADRDLYVGVRAGAIIGPRALLYAKGGYVNGRFGTRYTDPATASNNFDVAGELDGFRVGAGVQLGLGRHSYVKAEYRYSNYERGFAEKHDGVVGIGFRF